MEMGRIYMDWADIIKLSVGSPLDMYIREEILIDSAMENLEQAAVLYIDLVKERFHGTTDETFDKFQQLLLNLGQASDTADRSMFMFSEVSNLFSSKHYDLVDKFKDFLYHLDHNRGSSVESNVEEDNNKYARPVLEKESIAIVRGSCSDFINRVERILKDKDKVISAVEMICRYQQHGDVERVEREAYSLFKKHPELEIEFLEYLAEAKAGRTIQEMVVSKKRKREEAKQRTHRDADREWSELERKGFGIEDELYKQNMSYNMMLLAKEGALSLIRDNSERKHPRKIWIADYFRGVNVKFMREELNMKRYLDKCKLLSKKTMGREKAILKSEKFVRFLNSEIGFLTKDWSEEKRRLIRESRESDLEISVFDWQAARLTE